MSGQTELQQRRAGAATFNAAELAGMYLTFHVRNEEYGLEILKVREIIGLMSITSAPCSPDYVRGVINLRGKIIPVVDVRCKFGIASQPDTDETCIIVVNVSTDEGTIDAGILVDAVSEVLDIASEDIEGPPRLGSSGESGYILGMAKTGGTVRTLLDIDRVLVDELAASRQQCCPASA